MVRTRLRRPTGGTGRTDGAFLAALSLEELGAADVDSQMLVDQFRSVAPIRARGSIDAHGWSLLQPGGLGRRAPRSVRLGGPRRRRCPRRAARRARPSGRARSHRRASTRRAPRRSCEASSGPRAFSVCPARTSTSSTRSPARSPRCARPSRRRPSAPRSSAAAPRRTSRSSPAGTSRTTWPSIRCSSTSPRARSSRGFSSPACSSPSPASRPRGRGAAPSPRSPQRLDGHITDEERAGVVDAVDAAPGPRRSFQPGRLHAQRRAHGGARGPLPLRGSGHGDRGRDDRDSRHRRPLARGQAARPRRLLRVRGACGPARALRRHGTREHAPARRRRPASPTRRSPRARSRPFPRRTPNASSADADDRPPRPGWR